MRNERRFIHSIQTAQIPDQYEFTEAETVTILSATWDKWSAARYAFKLGFIRGTLAQREGET